MADDNMNGQASLDQIARRYLATLKPEPRQAAQSEVLKFVRWCGPERDLASMRGHEVETYAQNLPPTVSDASHRADFIRAFLKWSKEKGITETNLGTHLRVRKSNRSSTSATTVETQPVHLTREGFDGLALELEDLKARRPIIQQDLARAMADKDFRENAPLDAARNEQGHLEARIREIESTLRRAVVLDGGGGLAVDSAQIGQSVTIRDLRTGHEKTFTLVNTDEVRSGQGKISVASPVGKAVYQHHVGEEVDVEAPSGTIRFRIEAIRA